MFLSLYLDSCQYLYCLESGTVTGTLIDNDLHGTSFLSSTFDNCYLRLCKHRALTQLLSHKLAAAINTAYTINNYVLWTRLLVNILLARFFFFIFKSNLRTWYTSLTSLVELQYCIEYINKSNYLSEVGSSFPWSYKQINT